jgi:hypothetical protein
MTVTSSIRVFLRRVLGALSIVTMAACNEYPPLAPIEKPFGLGRGDESVEFDFRVTETHGHIVYLQIYFLDDEILSNSEGRQALINQLKPSLTDIEAGYPPNIPITLRIQVKSISGDGPSVDFDHITEKIGFRFAREEFAIKQVAMEINGQKLLPGIYRIRVENLKPVPEFAKRKVQISVAKSYYGK